MEETQTSHFFLLQRKKAGQYFANIMQYGQYTQIIMVVSWQSLKLMN